MKYAKLITLLLLLGSFSMAYTQNDTVVKAQRVAPWFVERFKLSAGFMASVNNTALKLGNNSGNIGSDVDFESDLGFVENKGAFITDFQWRSSRRSRFDFSFVSLHRDAIHTINKNITFGDHTYNASAVINSFFNTEIYRFSYGYALVSKPKGELGFSVGAHTLHASVGIGIHNTGGAGGTIRDDLGFTAPLPNLGIWGGYALSNRLAINGEFDYLAFKVGDVGGEILGYNLGLTYRVADNFDLSFGYTGFRFDIDVTTKKFNGFIDWGYRGFAITTAYSFGKKSWRH